MKAQTASPELAESFAAYLKSLIKPVAQSLMI